MRTLPEICFDFSRSLPCTTSLCHSSMYYFTVPLIKSLVCFRFCFPLLGGGTHGKALCFRFTPGLPKSTVCKAHILPSFHSGPSLLLFFHIFEALWFPRDFPRTAMASGSTSKLLFEKVELAESLFLLNNIVQLGRVLSVRFFLVPLQVLSDNQMRRARNITMRYALYYCFHCFFIVESLPSSKC